MNEASVQAEQSLEELVALVADEFQERRERGERPTVEEYARRYPRHGEVLRQILTALEMVSGAVSASAGDAAKADEEPPRALGDYRIVREIGRGGMGVVYEAEQLSLRRRVALKVLPFAATLDPKHLQRFQNEAQAAAHLHHPHIVPVYGVGSERSVHFYAMQYIEGQTLAALIAELRRHGRPADKADAALAHRAPSAPQGLIDPEPTRPYSDVPVLPAPDFSAPSAGAVSTAFPAGGLSTEHSHRSPSFFRTAAQLGVQAAEALEHSHQMGVIHRDIKPANLLIDFRGHLWVTDFGLAHMYTDTRLTLTGDLVGTLRYMSPEQALAKRVTVDQRTDIYSLGATLYELLALAPVFSGTDRQELLRQIAFEEPRPPRRLNAAIPAELETIVLKALAKNPEERYPTAKEMAEDLQRFLDDQPIRAKRPTLLQRLRKFARRHRPMVTTVAVSAFLLIVGLLVAAAVAYYRTREALDQAKIERQRAEEMLQAAWQANEDMYTQVAEKWLAREPRMQEVQREFLLKALNFYERFAQANQDSARWQLETGKAYRRVGAIHQKLEQFDKSAAAFRRAIALLETPPEGHAPAADYRAEQAHALQGLGDVLKHTGRLAQAIDTYSHGMALAEKLVAQGPENPRYRHRLVILVGNLADARSDIGQLTQARSLYERSLKLNQELCADVAGEPDYQATLAVAQLNFGNLLDDLGDLDLAEKLFRAATTSLTKLVEDHPHRPDYREHRAASRGNLAGLLLLVGQDEAAEQEFRGVLEDCEKLAAEFPSVPKYKARLANSYSNWSVTFSMLPHRHKDAVGALDKAIALSQPLTRDSADNPDYHDSLALLRINLGAMLEATGRAKEAEEEFRQAVAIRAKLVADFPRIVDYRRGLAHAHFCLGDTLERTRPEEAEACYGRALAVCREMKADFPDVPETHETQGMVKMKLGRLERQRKDLGKALALREEAAGHMQAAVDANPRARRNSHRLGDYVHEVAELLAELDRRKESEKLLLKAVEIREKLTADFPSVPDFQSELGASLNNLAMRLRERGELEEARKLLKRAISHQQAALKVNDQRERYWLYLRNHCAVLSDVLRKQGNIQAAAEARREALHADEFLVKLRPMSEKHRTNLGGDGHVLAALLKQMGQYREGLEIDFRTLKVAEDLAADFPESPDYARQVAADQMALARFLTTGPDRKLWDAAKALELAKKAVAFDPKHKTYRHVLGVAHYRNGNWHIALGELRQSVALTGATDAFNGFFLAMAHWKLGEETEARRYFQLSEQWLLRAKSLPAPLQETLRRIQTEAMKLLEG